MRAVQVTKLGGPESLELVEVDEPEPRDGEVLIDVHAAGVSFPDLLLSRGEYQLKPNPPFTPGAEVAGIVRSAPEGAHVAAGDRVLAITGLAGFAEVVAADTDGVFPLPDSMSFVAGAAIPMNYLTVDFAYSHRGRLIADETVLIHGAAGGVGTAGIQLAKALGARVIAVVSTDDKVDVARTAGADNVVLADGFKDAAKELTNGRGVDVVLDPVGGDRFTDSLRSLAPEGRLLVVGFAGGEIPTVKVNRLLLNNVEVVGVAWGEYALNHAGYLQRQWERIEPHVASGALDPPIASEYPLADAAAAVGELAARRVQGKIVLTVR